MNDDHGAPDAENPEWTEADFATARRWRPGDPLSRHEPAKVLRAAAERLIAMADTRDDGQLPPKAVEEIEKMRAALAWEDHYSAA